MGDKAFEKILIKKASGYATIVFNRPDKLNPLDVETLLELYEAVSMLDKDPELRAIVFTGSGRGFSAGGDMERYLNLFKDPAAFRAFVESWYRLFEFMEWSGKIYIAAINGICVAGGHELLHACDLVIASEDARIGDAHVNFSQLPGAGSSVRAWRAIGAIRAKHLMLTGDMMTAREAERIGLVGEVTPAGELEAGVERLVQKLKAKSPAVLKGMKTLLNKAIRDDLEDALRYEIAFVERFSTTEPDVREGLLAFKEKRKPRYAMY